jgi:hypothetical protein
MNGLKHLNRIKREIRDKDRQRWSSPVPRGSTPHSCALNIQGEDAGPPTIERLAVLQLASLQFPPAESETIWETSRFTLAVA